MKRAAVLKLSYMPLVSVSETSCRGLELCVSMAPEESPLSQQIAPFPLPLRVQAPPPVDPTLAV